MAGTGVRRQLEQVGKPGVLPVQKAVGLQDVREGSFGGAVRPTAPHTAAGSWQDDGNW